ncbi:MAG: SEC-C domain-containing protein [Clostridiales bacterium]|jgi:hypothetical protein|nr:SEC-C domain-containing protein [Clostridiales bacterium]
MTKSESMQIFNRFNKESDLKPCPEDKAELAETLDLYARAAVNLYGCVSKRKLASIFTEHEKMPVTPQEVQDLLLPYVLKRRNYFFCKDFLADSWGTEDFEYIRFLHDSQKGLAAAYNPSKEEFLKFADPSYRDPYQAERWKAVRKFVAITSPMSNIDRFMRELVMDGELGYDISNFSLLEGTCDISFETVEKRKIFFKLHEEAVLHTRMRQYSGMTPRELMDSINRGGPWDLEKLDQKNHSTVAFRVPCPCGSGKSLQDCCIEAAGANASLSASDSDLFCDTWIGLMHFINERTHIVPREDEVIHPDDKQGINVYARVREELCKNPIWIDKCLAEGKFFGEKKALLQSWRGHYNKKSCLMVSPASKHDIVLAETETGEDKLFCVKGVSWSISNFLSRTPPYYFAAVILPFKDKIVTDGCIRIDKSEIDEASRKELEGVIALSAMHGLITRLDS